MPGDKRLAAYVVPSNGALEEADLRRHLKRRLPGYFVPSAITIVDRLPQLPSGKLDRRALPPPAAPSPGADLVAPRTPTESAIASIWTNVLGLDEIGVHHDFFDLGGHSLLATRATARMREAFGVDMPLSLIFDRPTVAAAAEVISELVVADVERLSEGEAHELLGEARS
jgi:hypothetical protein